MSNSIIFVGIRISIIGGGYVGLVSAICFADMGNSVKIIEKDLLKVNLINAATPPIYEKGLEEQLKIHAGKNLTATTSYTDILDTDITIICVGTPDQEDGSANLKYLEEACTSIGNELKNKESYHLIIVKSTVPPGTTRDLVIPTVLSSCLNNNKNIGFAVNPEFLREGRAIDDFFHPDRIIIGCENDTAEKMVQSLYYNIEAPKIRTSLIEAEMIKYASNAFLATKISFSNEIGNICKKIGIDVYKVMDGVGLDHRISPHFLNAGIGFGGSCFPKDVKCLISLAETYGEDPQLLKSVMNVNSHQPLKLVELLIRRIGPLQNKRIALLGLAFKDNTDDIRESRAIPVVLELQRRGAIIAAYDPVAIPSMQKIVPDIEYGSTAAEALKGADAALILTEWPEFRSLQGEFDLMKSKIIIEGRRILSYEEKEGICW